MNTTINPSSMLEMIHRERENLATLVQLGHNSLAGSLAVNKPNCLYKASGQHFDQSEFEASLEKQLMQYIAALCGRGAISLLELWEGQGQPRSNLALIREKFGTFQDSLNDAEKYLHQFERCFDFAALTLAVTLYHLDVEHRQAFYQAKADHRAKFGRMDAPHKAKLRSEHINHGLFRLPHLVIRDKQGKIESISTARLISLLILISNLCGSPILPHQLEMLRYRLGNAVMVDGLAPVEIKGIILSSDHEYLCFELRDDMAEKLKQQLMPLYSAIGICAINSNYNYLLAVPETA